jgi:hypothetical protein
MGEVAVAAVMAEEADGTAVIEVRAIGVTEPDNLLPL